ncbi:hypothetical protein CLU95_3993 [Variovorax sp. 54]|uniref:WD40/YVTN/BNR-like repeat-containing protein n=1 Tax=Variovorax sp. 54 TaxID=2035212 RepID=UPI000C68C40B|nr:hypothetical protein [Variovorax sp. 54]PIF76825.1 hypothetical protein CLU95_3993 [Variovorax sp. 54]
MFNFTRQATVKNPRSSLFRLMIAPWLTVSLLLSGCAIAPISPEERAKNAPGSLQLTSAQGVVSLKITSNRARVSTYFSQWSKLWVKNLETSGLTSLSNRSDSIENHSLFVGALLAGTYEIHSVESSASGMATLTNFADASDVLPGFAVAAGQLTDLGTIAFMRKHYPVDSREFQWGIAPEASFDRQAILRRLNPVLRDQLSVRPVLGWSDGDRLRARRKTHDQFLGLTMRAASPVLQPDGSALFGESFGQIAVRSAQGTWSFLQTPTSQPIRSLHVGRGGELYAGSDNGLLMVRRTATGSWESIALPADDSSVIHVGPLPGSADVLVVLQTSDRFLGLSVDAAPNRPLKEQFSKPRALFSNPMNDVRGYVLEASSQVLFAMGAFQSKTEVLKYSGTDPIWRDVSSGDENVPSNWASLNDGSVGRFAGIPMTGMYFMTSQDNGKSWERRGDLNWANGSLLFVSEKVGYVIRLDSRAAFDPELIEQSVWRTNDAGHTWSLAGSPKTIGGALVALGGTEKIGYVGLNGRFMVSVDGGKTWRAERVLP